jgi:exodeoxyribonuclease VII large subunit
MVNQGGGRRRPLSVFAVTRALKGVIEQAFDTISVEGEVFSARNASSGHLYFTLKDSRAQLPCVMWRSSAAMLSEPLRDGMKVVATGEINLYEPHGRYQMVVRRVEPSGLGQLLVKLEELRKLLLSEGLFAPERKKPLPFLPRRVGVVTAATGAAVQDIVETIHNRYPMPILLVPTAVQGSAAVAGIVRGIQMLDRTDDVDVIIVGRGGGSLQDLWAFNDEAVVRAIAACETPIVSAVGHEVDTLLSDYAADHRSATPTAAGEAVVPSMRDLQTTLRVHRERLRQGLGLCVSRNRLRLESLLRKIGDPRRLVAERQQALDELSMRLEMRLQDSLARSRERSGVLSARLRNLHPASRVGVARQRWSTLSGRLERAMGSHLSETRRDLQGAREALNHLSPVGSLERGYAIVRHGNGGVVTDSSRTSTGDSIEILLHRGAIDATVVGTKTKNHFEPENP